MPVQGGKAVAAEKRAAPAGLIIESGFQILPAVHRERAAGPYPAVPAPEYSPPFHSAPETQGPESPSEKSSGRNSSTGTGSEAFFPLSPENPSEKGKLFQHLPTVPGHLRAAHQISVSGRILWISSARTRISETFQIYTEKATTSGLRR